MSDPSVQNNADESLVAIEHPRLLAAIEAEAVVIAESAGARSARNYARLAELADERAGAAGAAGSGNAEGIGRALAAIFRRRVREFGLN